MLKCLSLIFLTEINDFIWILIYYKIVDFLSCIQIVRTLNRMFQGLLYWFRNIFLIHDNAN